MTHPGAFVTTIPPLNFEGSGLWTSPFLLSQEFCDCTYHGKCIPFLDSEANKTKTICLCEPHWTGLSDFMDARGASCHINTTAVEALWIINLSIWALALLSMSGMIIDMCKKHRASKLKMKLKGKKYTLLDNQGLLSIVLALTICAPGLTLVGILRLSFPNSRVAIDVVVTMMWLVGRGGIGIATAFHQPTLMRQILQAQSTADDIVRDYDRYGKMLAFFQAAAALWSIPVLVTRGQDIVASRWCFALFCAHVSLGFSLLSRQSHVLQSTLYKILTESANTGGNAHLIQLRDRLCSAQSKVRKQTIAQALIYLAYAATPPLWLTYDYMLPISWITPAIVLRNVVSAIHDEKDADKGPSNNSGNTGQGKSGSGKGTDGNGNDNTDDSRKPFEMPKTITYPSSSKAATSYFVTSNVVSVNDPEDSMLTATGPAWTRLLLKGGRHNNGKGKVNDDVNGNEAGDEETVRVSQRLDVHLENDTNEDSTKQDTN